MFKNSVPCKIYSLKNWAFHHEAAICTQKFIIIYFQGSVNDWSCLSDDILPAYDIINVPF